MLLKSSVEIKEKGYILKSSVEIKEKGYMRIKHDSPFTYRYVQIIHSFYPLLLLCFPSLKKSISYYQIVHRHKINNNNIQNISVLMTHSYLSDH